MVVCAGRVESVKCYVGTVTNTRVANDLLNLLPQQLCNSTETIIYDGCYSVCQEMIFQNSSDGVVTPIGTAMHMRAVGHTWGASLP